MNTFYDYLPYMQSGGFPPQQMDPRQQMAAQQQMAPQQQQMSDQQNQIMQIIQMYAEIAQQDPRQIMEQLRKMEPDQQQEAIEYMAKAVQEDMNQQEAPSQPMMKMGGMSGNPGTYSDGYSGTYDAGTGSYFAQGGSYVPDYSMAYGGAFDEIPSLFYRDAYSNPVYKDGGEGGEDDDDENNIPYAFTNTKGKRVSAMDALGQMGSYANKMRQFFSKAPGAQPGTRMLPPMPDPNMSTYGNMSFPGAMGNPFATGQMIGGNMMMNPAMMMPAYQGMMPRMYSNGGSYSKSKKTTKAQKQEGGIVVGQEMQATPEILQKLREGGYTFEYVD